MRILRFSLFRIAHKASPSNSRNTIQNNAMGSDNSSEFHPSAHSPIDMQKITSEIFQPQKSGTITLEATTAHTPDT